MPKKPRRPWDAAQTPLYPHRHETARKYINAIRCATVFKKGFKAGSQCKGYAVKGMAYCKRHNNGDNNPNIGSEPGKPAHLASVATWWERMRAIEAANPGFLRQFLQGTGGTAAAYRERIRMQKERGLGTVLLPLSDLVGTKEPALLKAHGRLIKMKGMLGPPNPKPPEEMEPHEILVHNLRLSLDRTTELLQLPIQKKIPQADGTDLIEIDYKAAAIVKDAALRVGAMQIKVDRNALAARRLDKMAELLDRLKAEDALGTENSPKFYAR